MSGFRRVIDGMSKGVQGGMFGALMAWMGSKAFTSMDKIAQLPVLKRFFKEELQAENLDKEILETSALGKFVILGALAGGVWGAVSGWMKRNEHDKAIQKNENSPLLASQTPNVIASESVEKARPQVHTTHIQPRSASYAQQEAKRQQEPSVPSRG